MGIGECYACGCCMNIDLMHYTQEGILLCPRCFRNLFNPSKTSRTSRYGETCPYCDGSGEDYFGMTCEHCSGTGMIESDD